MTFNLLFYNVLAMDFERLISEMIHIKAQNLFQYISMNEVAKINFKYDCCYLSLFGL